MRYSPYQFPNKIYYRVASIQAAFILFTSLLGFVCAKHFYRKFLIRSIEINLAETLTTIPKNHDVTELWCKGVVGNSKFRLQVTTADGQFKCRFGDDSIHWLTASHASQEEGGYTYTLGFPEPEMMSSLNGFNQALGVFLLTVLSGVLLVSFWASRKLVAPIGRILTKTQNLVAPTGYTAERDFEESFGEWSELETNIDDIRRNLERTAQTLTMEQIELDTVMGAISDAILAVDPEGVPLFYNTRFEVVFGGGGIRRNIKLYEIVRDPEILNAYDRALRDGKVAITKAFSHESAGEKRYFSLSVSPLRKQGGVIYGALGIFHDITELKAAEQMRIDFVANVSHELRTPLTAIKGYAETLFQDVEKNPKPFDGTGAKDYLQVITRNTTRLMNLMEDLLDLSSIESATLLQRDTLSTEELTLRVLKQVQTKCEKKQQRIEAEYDAKMVHADPNRLEQVLINLLDNAHKYSPEGGKLKVKWEPDREGGKDVFLKVTDTGPGISVEHQRRLFERFYRIDKARSREQGGTGLGLAIVKHIMQRHEGAVWVDSTLGQGATFICRFPG